MRLLRVRIEEFHSVTIHCKAFNVPWVTRRSIPSGLILRSLLRKEEFIQAIPHQLQRGISISSLALLHKRYLCMTAQHFYRQFSCTAGSSRPINARVYVFSVMATSGSTDNPNSAAIRSPEHWSVALDKSLPGCQVFF